MMAARIARTAVLPVLAMAVTVAVLISAHVGPSPASPAAAQSTPADPTWQTALEAMDRALDARDISAAEVAWRDAYVHAFRSRQWDALFAVGTGALRIGDHVAVQQPYRARARQLWLSALFRARQQRAVDGAIATAEAFAALGDVEAVKQALHIADQVAALDASGDAARRVASVRGRLRPGAA